MIKVRLWGESAEIESMIELICNHLPVRVLSVSGHYKDRGASVYERCYLDVVINDQATGKLLELGEHRDGIGRRKP